MTSPLSALVQRLSELEAKATPGPLQVMWNTSSLVHLETGEGCPIGQGVSICSMSKKHRADAELFAEAINALPVLLAALGESRGGPGRWFPLQTDRPSVKPGPLRIPWIIAEKAYSDYARRYGRDQSLERLAERHGFSWAEMDQHYPPWRDEVDEVAKLRARVAELESALSSKPSALPPARDAEVAALVAERDALAGALKALDSWRARMPDAEFNDASPHWKWWHEAPLAQVRAALGGTQTKEAT